MELEYPIITYAFENHNTLSTIVLKKFLSQQNKFFISTIWFQFDD